MAELKPYPKYKDSGVEWIGEIPEEWDTAKLKYLSNEKFIYGANESAQLDDKNLPRYIRITDIDDHGKLKKETFKSLPFKKAKNYLLQKGDILFARSGATVGKTYYHSNNDEACFAGYLIRFRGDKEKIHPKFVYYYTQTASYKNWIKGNTIQATIENISAEKYSNLIITLPIKKHQDKIVKYLDIKIFQIDSLISDKKR